MGTPLSNTLHFCWDFVRKGKEGEEMETKKTEKTRKYLGRGRNEKICKEGRGNEEK